MTDQRIVTAVASTVAPYNRYTSSRSSILDTSQQYYCLEIMTATRNVAATAAGAHRSGSTGRVATCTRIRQAQKQQSFETVQQQTFNILQHLFECSIAGICKDRRLFPDYFFLDYDSNKEEGAAGGDRRAGGLILSKFDLEMLLSPPGGVSAFPCNDHHDNECDEDEEDHESRTTWDSPCSSSSIKNDCSRSNSTVSTPFVLANFEQERTMRTMRTRYQHVDESPRSRSSCVSQKYAPDDYLPSLSPLTCSVQKKRKRPTTSSFEYKDGSSSSSSSRRTKRREEEDDHDHGFENNNATFTPSFTDSNNSTLARNPTTKWCEDTPLRRRRLYKNGSCTSSSSSSSSTTTTCNNHHTNDHSKSISGSTSKNRRNGIRKSMSTTSCRQGGDDQITTRRSMVQESQNDYRHQHEHYRTEALLLLHWIRHGVVEMMKREELGKFFFAIVACCHSRPSWDHDDDEEQQDRIVESYEFDMTQLKLDYNLKMNGVPTSAPHSCYINYQELKSQYDALFRNLQSLVRTSTLSEFRYGQRRMKSQMEEEDVLPRYFNLRIEFDSRHRQASSCMSTNTDSYFPLAINPGTAMNTLFLASPQGDDQNCPEDHTDHTALPTRTLVPLIVDSIENQSAVPLGSLCENNVTGIGVKVASYQLDDNHDYECFDFETRTLIRSQGYEQTMKYKYGLESPSTKKSEKKRDREKQDLLVHTGDKDHHLHVKRSKTAHSFSTAIGNGYVQEQKSGLDLLQNQSKAYAIPNYKPQKSNHVNMEKKSVMFLPCTILDHRIRKGAKLDYKVLFLDPNLDKLRIKKQWISSKKIIGPKTLRHQLYSHLDQMDLRQYSFKKSKMTKHLALKLRIPLKVFQNDFGKALKNSSIQQSHQHEDSIKNKRDASYFVFAKDPVTFVV